ncbi:MAG: TnpV protein [Clostridiales bacterium]|nr:TnpV protein [Clostridiales bacterium]
MGEYEEALEALRLTPEQIAEQEAWEAENDPRPTLGKYGIMFREFLREHYPWRYEFLKLEAELFDTCLAVDREAMSMMETLESQLRAKTPRPTDDFMKIYQYETAIRDQAEEIVLNEIVYKER